MTNKNPEVRPTAEDLLRKLCLLDEISKQTHHHHHHHPHPCQEARNQSQFPDRLDSQGSGTRTGSGAAGAGSTPAESGVGLGLSHNLASMHLSSSSSSSSSIHSPIYEELLPSPSSKPSCSKEETHAQENRESNHASNSCGCCEAQAVCFQEKIASLQSELDRKNEEIERLKSIIKEMGGSEQKS